MQLLDLSKKNRSSTIELLFGRGKFSFNAKRKTSYEKKSTDSANGNGRGKINENGKREKLGVIALFHACMLFSIDSRRLQPGMFSPHETWKG